METQGQRDRNRETERQRGREAQRQAKREADKRREKCRGRDNREKERGY